MTGFAALWIAGVLALLCAWATVGILDLAHYDAPHLQSRALLRKARRGVVRWWRGW